METPDPLLDQKDPLPSATPPSPSKSAAATNAVASTADTPMSPLETKKTVHHHVAHIANLKAKQAVLETERQRIGSLYPVKYWSGEAKSVIDWHVANLEFANATTLNTLSLEHWDQDDANEFTGEHLTVRDGFGTVPKALSTGLDVKMEVRVTNVAVSPEGGATVKYHSCAESDGSGGAKAEEQEVNADAVIVTVPLGILKEGVIRFQPPLPDWKQDSINKLGFGLLNKVILCFDFPFWKNKFDTFGSCAPPSGTVGELYMFWNFMPCTGQPILLAINAGEAAVEAEANSDGVVVAKSIAVLRKIFGVAAVPEPVHSHVTRWRNDPFARGSYSYISTEASGEDYDTLAKPITVEGAEKAQLFFAGEHTNRNYPATVHGAMLSGLREAGRIADLYPAFTDSTTGGAAAAAEEAEAATDVTSEKIGTKRKTSEEVQTSAPEVKKSNVED
jgi:lysine-specific histone demethylase 1